ncbi:MAG: RNA polymerase sigma factor [Phycisphaeraceae bacterium]|nr:RNA polymerase sigma factor [Phycisphaeraceae bacterium]
MPDSSRHGAPSLRLVDDRTDEQLLEDYRDGDDAAFRTLIDRHQGALLRFLIRFLGNRALAEDVFQETFIKVHVSAATFDTSRRFKPWLFTIAANTARDYRRREARRPTVGYSAPISNGGDSRPFVDLMAIDLPGPEASLDAQEQSDRVQRVIDTLPPHLNEILLMSYFQKMSYAQVADALEIPLGTVKSRLHSAVAAFGRAWQEANAGDDDDESQGGRSENRQ